MCSSFESKFCSAFNIHENDIFSSLQLITSFLAEYSWVYDYRNIDILICDALGKIPSDWVEVLSKISAEELGQLPFGYQKEEWPVSLKSFLTKCKDLGSYRFSAEKFQVIIDKDKCPLKRLKVKKEYEIQRMSFLVNQVCRSLDCTAVIDIGSGLGYVDQILHNNFGICCIGLDSFPQYTLVARKRLKKEKCVNSVIHKTLEVKNSEEGLLELRAVIEEAKKLHCTCKRKDSIASGKQAAILASLHSCGNLSQDMIQMFCKLDNIRGLVCIGCCYNKIDLSDFPMSMTGKNALSSTQEHFPSWRPSIFGLRLAAHSTRTHLYSFPIGEEREKHIFYRCLLEYYVNRENIVWKQPKRHIRETDLVNFTTYCSKMFEEHPLNGDSRVLSELNILYQEKLEDFPKIKILLVLQIMLQPLWEVFVVLDRFMYLKEKNISVEVIEMWDDRVSPRNLAICAYKR